MNPRPLPMNVRIVSTFSMEGIFLVLQATFCVSGLVKVCHY